MIGSNDEWPMELRVKKNFTVSIADISTIEIDGIFDEDEILYNVAAKFDPEYVYENGELDKWALNNGYILDDK